MASVIIIDDDMDSVEIMEDYLNLHNIKVLGIGNDGRDAYLLYNAFKPDVVLLDMFMPEFDGPYAIKKIKEYDPKAKIIAITAYDKYQFKKGEISAKIRKPYNVTELIETIKEVAEKDG